MSKISLLFSAWASAVKPIDKLPIEEWASKHVFIMDSAVGSPKFSADQAPWLVPVMRAVADNDNKEVVMIAPIGAGKTTIIEAMLPWFVAEESGNVLIASQSDTKAGHWAETRAFPSLKMCDPVKPLFPKDRHKVRKTDIIFPHMAIYIGGAGMGNLQSSSIRWVIGDEPWLWKTGRMQEARGRTHKRWNARVFFVSQAGVSKDVPWTEHMGNPDLHEAWLMTDQQEFHWECPECGNCKAWEWMDFTYNDGLQEGDTERNWREVEDSVRMNCPNCEAVFKDEPMTRWKLTRGSKPVAKNHKNVRGHRGYTFTAMMVPRFKWGELAVEWVRANEAKNKGNTNPLRMFFQKRLAQFWNDDIGGEVIDLVGSGYLIDEVADGSLINDEKARIMTVDVQGEGGRHFWALIRAYRNDGTSRLINCGRVETWQDLERIRERFNVSHKLVFVDGQYESEEVKQFCAYYKWHIFLGSKQNRHTHTKGKKKVERCYSPRKQFIFKDARINYWFLGVNAIKDVLAILANGEGLSWETPDNPSDDYVRQMKSEVKRDVINKNTKERSRRWVKTNQNNHLWDCEMMNLAGAMIAGIITDFDMLDEDSEE